MENQGKETWPEHLQRIKMGAPLDPNAEPERPKISATRPQPTDSPDSSGDVIRKHHRQAVATPIVGQFTLEGDIQHQATDYRGILKKLTPLEEAARQAAEGQQDPSILRAANRQLRAKNRNILKTAQKRSRGTETPPEH